MIKRLYIPAIFLVLALCFSCNQPSGNPAGTAIAPANDTLATPPVPDSSKPADQLATRIGELLRDQLVKKDLDVLTDEDRRFSYTEADLNGDDAAEIFVAMKGRYFCGNAGCTVFLLNSKGEKINAFTIVNGAIAVSTDKTRGWYDLVIPSSGHYYRVKYKGASYPGNPSVQPEFKGALPAASRMVLADSAAVYHF